MLECPLDVGPWNLELLEPTLEDRPAKKAVEAPSPATYAATLFLEES
jgi:hypothetical protein